MFQGPIFEDRQDAGRLLAERLEPYRDEAPVVLGLPRGGVVLGYEIARALDAPLDVVVARKVGAPGHEELGVGAVAPGVTLADERTLYVLDIDRETFEALAARAREEMSLLLRLYRGEAGLPDVEGKTAILVDDGLATGVTATAAAHAVRQLKPKRLVLAAAVCARETARSIRGLVDDLVCLSMPHAFGAVGLWYRDFRQVTDAEVLALLEKARLFDDAMH